MRFAPRRRGINVHGIDASEAMVARRRSKAGGERIPVTVGDFADVAIEGRYALFYVVVNTLFALPTQEAQIQCFRNVAAHLAERLGSLPITGHLSDA